MLYPAPNKRMAGYGNGLLKNLRRINIWTTVLFNDSLLKIQQNVQYLKLL